MARKISTKNAPAKTNRRLNGETRAGKKQTKVIPAAARTIPISGKLGMVAASITEPDGATLDHLMKTTNWQPHTVRAALSRLRKRGMVITLATVDDRKAYVATVGS